MGENKRSPKLACESWFRTFFIGRNVKEIVGNVKNLVKIKNSHKNILLCEKKFVPSLSEIINVDL